MRFSGIVPAMVTPFDVNGDLNTAAVPALVEMLLAEGVGGLFVAGSTGEWWLLEADEREALAAATVAAVNGRVPVMLHVGANSTRTAARLARHAEQIGADAISLLPPIGRPYPNDAIWQHFRTIADTCQLPLYLYHLPQIYGEQIGIREFVEALDTIPTLAGAKFSSYRIDDLLKLRHYAGDRLNILSGCSEQLLSAWANGVDGTICSWYNVIPRLGRRIIETLDANDLAAARQAQDLLITINILSEGYTFGLVKWAVAQTGIACGTPRLPLPQLPDELAATLPNKLREAGLFDWSILASAARAGE